MAAAALVSVVVILTWRDMNCRVGFRVGYSYDGGCGTASVLQVALLILAIIGGAIVVAAWGKADGAAKEDAKSENKK